MSKSKKNKYVVRIHFQDKFSYAPRFTETDNIQEAKHCAEMFSSLFGVWYTEIEELVNNDWIPCHKCNHLDNNTCSHCDFEEVKNADVKE